MRNKARKRWIQYFFLFLIGFGLLLILAGIHSLLSSQPTLVESSSSTAVNPASTCGSPSGGPMDNPVATKYGTDAYPWTNSIKWNCVYNLNDFKGSTLIDRFNAARDAAAASGGGVVYFPAGNYSFTDSIFLKEGIVIRGETPTLTEAKSNSYSPQTRFIFPKYEPRFSENGTPNDTAFKKILTTSPDSDSNLGIVNVDINRAGIKLLGNLDTGKQQNIIVFGIRNNNVADPTPNVPEPSFQDGWLRYSDRFAANISINAYANVLVSNNRLNDDITDSYEQRGYKVKSIQGNTILTYVEGNKVPFHYGNHYGIVVNRSKNQGFALAAEPNTEPGLFRQGIVIRDNWVYHTMRIGIQAAGDVLVIKDNQITDQPNKQWWTDPTGIRQPRGAVTYENRAIDWSGWNVQVEGNSYQVYRHQIMDTRYLSVDGEGILIQECCGGTTVNGAVIRKNEGNAYIGLYKIPSIRNVVISENTVRSEIKEIASIYVNANTNNRPGSLENVVIENNTINGDILAQGTLGGEKNLIKNNTNDASGSLQYSCNVTVQENTGLTLEPCLKVNSPDKSL